jgi:hypothetical protein
VNFRILVLVLALSAGLANSANADCFETYSYTQYGWGGGGCDADNNCHFEEWEHVCTGYACVEWSGWVEYSTYESCFDVQVR